MTVAELIAELQKFPPDLEVMKDAGEDLWPIDYVQPGTDLEYGPNFEVLREASIVRLR